MDISALFLLISTFLTWCIYDSNRNVNMTYALKCSSNSYAEAHQVYCFCSSKYKRRTDVPFFNICIATPEKEAILPHKVTLLQDYYDTIIYWLPNTVPSVTV